ncbi:MAG: NAD(P)/FAD-dependent oxidoreductase [Parachlamydia sp.]|nr:NAD(P)/FAD-dependent oxidoreductase [Parachlamydia sp.]
MAKKMIVVGGGAAGYFAAIVCAEAFPQHTVILLEKTRQPLAKVKISGGGRCNVTHACFDPPQLVKSYPRGSRELLGPFHQFQPRDTIAWFEKRGVQLKVEEDGRMFPITNQSETIIQCLQEAARRAKVELHLEAGVQSIKKEGDQFCLTLATEIKLKADCLLIATGSNAKIYAILEELGHTIIPPVPSLFTFNSPASPFLELAGISVDPVVVSLPEFKMEQKGPLLLTHWGFSGPAVLKLSAWGARELCAAKYQAMVKINWLPEWTQDKLREALLTRKKEMPAKQLGSESLFSLPKQLWRLLLQESGINPETRFAIFSIKHSNDLIQRLVSTQAQIQGKTTYKQEFVTCGGISLKEVNFKTMESRRCPGLFFAGEVLDIGGITGGFNFQNAWSTAWIAGHSMGSDD